MMDERKDGINEEQDDTPPTERLNELICSAAGIGICIIIHGALPESKRLAYLILTAICVCATNAVRHARADKMFVQINAIGQTTDVSITNNGEAPKGEIIEGGGLSGLRCRAEKAGGVLTVESLPKFKLKLALPKEERIL